MGQEKYRSADIQIWRNEENITPSIVITMVRILDGK